MADVLVWVTGARSGLGAALLEEVPFQDAQLVNISRRRVDGVDNVAVDLSDPGQWDRAEEDFRQRLSRFGGSFAVFIHSAVYMETYGFAGEMASGEYLRQTLANAAAPLFLGHAFVAASPPLCDAGIVMISSNGASNPTEGASTYCAGKSAMESWVTSVAKERSLRKSSLWTLGVRPGWVNTPGMQVALGSASDDFPAARRLETVVESGMVKSPKRAARQIWDLIISRPASGTVIDLRAYSAP